MRYKEFGKTGLKVSVLGMGTLRFPKTKGHANADLFVRIIKHAFDLGINYVDTAAMTQYGSETVIGKAVKGVRNRIFIATKNHYRGDSADEWEKLLHKSLRSMDTDYIDFYHLHNLKWNDYRKHAVPGKIMERFRKAKEKGIIRHICFSTHDTPENIVKLIDTGEFEGVLVQYNLLDRANEDAIAYAHEKKMGVAVMGPVGGGRLAAPSGKIGRLIPGAHGTPEIALRFVLSNPHVTLALSGMTSMKMLEENVDTAGRKGRLSNVEKEKIAGALKGLDKLANLYCTGCRYCMPCPHHVDIPGNFEAMNYYRVWDLQEYAKALYRQKGRNRSRRWAEACVECGQCESKCPQNIPIMSRLKEVARTLGKSGS
jgi:predicted aldo/keto reductase-like oxidoreductase